MTRTLRLFLASLAIAAGALPAHAQMLPDYPISLRNIATGLCLDIFQNDTRTGGQLIQWQCHSNANQQWMLYRSGQAYEIVNQNSGLCLDVRGGQRNNGVDVIQWTCMRQPNQLWYVTPGPDGLILRNVNSNRCLDVPRSSTRAGERLVQWDCNGGRNQSFGAEVG
jgi:arabinan endo-1,5-alpha-L-arabinosidase